MPEENEFDVVLIGAGPGGEVAVTRLVDQGLRVAIVERELIGGECAYWGCIPSKTLLRGPDVIAEADRVAGVDEPGHHWPAIAEYRDFMIRNLDDAAQVDGYEKQGVTVVKGAGRIAGHGRVEAGDRMLTTERIIVATGSDAAMPPIDGLDSVGAWTNREATTVKDLPRSLVVLGGGPVGIEMGQLFARLGVQVTLVEMGDRLVARETSAVGELIAEALRADGIDVRLGARATSARRDNGQVTLGLEGGEDLVAEQILVATGRRPRVDGIGLETVGIEPGAKGIAIDKRCRAGDGIWAIGDVTGVMPFTHVAKYQGRIAAADIAGRAAFADYAAIPRVVFSDPEAASVGLTEEQARESGIDVVCSRVSLPETIARPWTYEREPRGELGLIADRARRVLVGAWAVAPLASEWIHQPALAIKTGTPIDILLDTVPQFPTFSEALFNGVEALAI